MNDTPIIGLDDQPVPAEPPQQPDPRLQFVLEQTVFPININNWQSFGISKRELFAAMILSSNQHAAHDIDVAVRAAVKAADALFAALHAKPTGESAP